MSDLEHGSTVGGSVILTQANLPLHTHTADQISDYGTVPMNVKHNGGMWISQRDSLAVPYRTFTNANSATTFAGAVAQKNLHTTFVIGTHLSNNLNSHFGIFGYTNTRTENGTDGSLTMDYLGNVGISGSLSMGGNLSASGNIYAAGNVTGYSDISLKNDIQPLTDSLNKIVKLNGVTYTRNDLDTDKRFVGLIAQEVREVLPEAVEEDENGILSVAYGNVISLAIEAIKELTEKVNTLERQINKN